jgi:hypothetical protein
MFTVRFVENAGSIESNRVAILAIPSCMNVGKELSTCWARQVHAPLRRPGGLKKRARRAEAVGSSARPFDDDIHKPPRLDDPRRPCCLAANSDSNTVTSFHHALPHQDGSMEVAV